MEIHRKDGEIENRPKSGGGKLFDFLTYFGIAGVGTFVATIPIANMFKEGGRFHHVDQSMRGFFKSLGASEKLAAKSTEVTHLMHGGNLMLIPVGIMEYFRTPIVKAFNRMLNDPTDPKSVEDAPPQTLTSILKARAIAWMTVFAGFWGTEKLMGSERYEAALDKAGNQWAKLRGRTPGTEGFQKAYDFGHTGALDVLATASSATLLYVSSHAFAKSAAEKRVHGAVEERRGAHAMAKPKDSYATTAETAPQSTQEKPTATITQVQREASVSTSNQEPVIAAL